MNEMELTPKQIVAELDKYIVGQSEAKKSVAIGTRMIFFCKICKLLEF